MIISETPRRQLVSKLVAWGHWFTLANIVIAIAISGVYLFSSRMPSSLLGMMYLFSNWFSHIGFITFFGFVILILPLCYLLPNSRFLRSYASFTAAIALALLALDALIYTRYGMHLSFKSVEFIRSQANITVGELTGRQWGFFAVSFFAWLMLLLTLANAFWKRIERLRKLKWGVPIGATFTGLFVFSHATHIWADAQLYHPIVQQDDMFPLSYPATAKTLMSKYGLLNMENYQQRKALQLNVNKRDIAYPTEPLYCVIDTQRKISLFWLIDDSQPNPSLMANHGLTMLSQHYDLSLNQSSAVKNILYGLPDLYHWQLRSHRPIISDLPTKLGLPVQLYSEQAAFVDGLKIARNDNWSEFVKTYQTNDYGIFIGFVTQTQLNTLLAQTNLGQSNVVSHHKVFVSQLRANQAVETYTNFSLSETREMSSHADLAATTLFELGCNADPHLHTTGQRIQTEKRTWLVTSQNDRVLILHQGLRIEVDSSGNFYIYNLDGTPNNSVELNTSLLAQAIKLLSRFADKQ